MLDAVERAAAGGLFAGREVLVQSGHNPDFHPLHCILEPFLRMEAFEEEIRAADLVVCHGGAGTLLTVLGAGRVPIVMPRRRCHAEIVDDHQTDLVRALAEEDRVVPAFEAGDLPGAVRKALQAGLSRSGPPRVPPLIALVSDAIDDLLLKKKPDVKAGARP